jgi:hypothetical protein
VCGQISRSDAVKLLAIVNFLTAALSAVDHLSQPLFARQRSPAPRSLISESTSSGITVRGPLDAPSGGDALGPNRAIPGHRLNFPTQVSRGKNAKIRAGSEFIRRMSIYVYFLY